MRIEFKTPVTFIVGENGAGKSTLMEGLVDLANLPIRGGGKNELSDHGGESELAPLEEDSRLYSRVHAVKERGNVLTVHFKVCAGMLDF